MKTGLRGAAGQGIGDLATHCLHNTQPNHHTDLWMQGTIFTPQTTNLLENFNCFQVFSEEE